jgi:hypothetical protein
MAMRATGKKRRPTKRNLKKKTRERNPRTIPPMRVKQSLTTRENQRPAQMSKALEVRSTSTFAKSSSRSTTESPPTDTKGSEKKGDKDVGVHSVQNGYTDR